MAADRLADAQQVALRVAEPGGPFTRGTRRRVVALDFGHAVDGAQPRHVHLLEQHSLGRHIGHDGLDVIDLEGHLGVLTGWPARRLEDREAPRRAHVPEPSRTLLRRLQAELLGIPPAGPVEVLGRQARGNPAVIAEAHGWRSCHDRVMTERAIRVFVSSTFRDMQGERDELVKRVFPELRHRCEERAVTWSEVDLRWGVTDEEKAEGDVLSICLAEIEHCRPFFLGLLGDRYGWVPDHVADALHEQEPWLAGAGGRSVTELEILHGVLNDPAQRGRAFFYLREPAYAAGRPPVEQATLLEGPTDDEVAALGAEAAAAKTARRRRQLADLKARIRASGYPVRDYPEPIALGPLVEADLARMIDDVFPPGAPVDAPARADAEQAAYAASLTRGVVGRAADLAALDAAVAGDGPPVLVTGEGGIGKSTLLATWAAGREPAPGV